MPMRAPAHTAVVQKSAESDAGRDARFMALALSLGRRGLGRTGTNPAVGAVVVKNGIVVGRGWTQPGGRPHAEIEALARAGEAARGATLYVTLEPCAHQGKSPPCADAVIAAGIARVVSALEDPNPQVAGEGHARLRAHGVAVDVGIGAEHAARDHAGHLRRMRDKRPHVILKLAVSADAAIAGPGNRTVRITGEAAHARAHLLRAQCDAILVGIGTVLADDPQLTCRLPGMAGRSPIRVVLDRDARLPPISQMVQGAWGVPLWVFTGADAGALQADTLTRMGADVIRVPAVAEGLALDAVMAELSARGVTRLLVEGGARVAASLMRADLIDEVHLFRSETVIGPGGTAALHDLPLTALTQAPHLRLMESERVGDDQFFLYGRD